VPPRAIARGVPARITPDAVPPGQFEAAVGRYVANAERYRRELRRID
jgi:hypothetical protein